MAGAKVHIPEVLEPEESLPSDLRALRRLAYLLDEAIAIPGTRKRIGLDAGLGLIPGVGDAIGAVLSSVILIGAVRHRVPLGKMGRMVGNILLDVGLGSIPIIGDVFDFLFEENVANLQLLMKHRNRQLPPRSFGQIFIAAVVILLAALGFSIAVTVTLVMLILWVIGQR